MKYKLRPGIVIAKVCGNNLLVPDRQASEKCPYILRISKLWAAHLTAMANGKPMDRIYTNHSIITKKSMEESQEAVDHFLSILFEKGFLIPVEDEDDPE